MERVMSKARAVKNIQVSLDTNLTLPAVSDMIALRDYRGEKVKTFHLS